MIEVSGVRRSWEIERSSDGLQLVAAPQRLGLHRLRLHPVALAGQRLQLGERPVGLLAAAARPRRARARARPGDACC